MDIVLNTAFENSLLPMAPVPGFADNFDRPTGASLGSTSREARPWQYGSNGAAPLWRTSSGGTAVFISGGAISAAVVDALAANGALQVTAASLGSNRRGGPAFRYRDINNHLFIWQPDAVSPLGMFRRVNGEAVRIGSSTYSPTNGDIFRIELSGPNIIFKVNGTVIMTVMEAALLGETRHGMIGTTQALQMGWDDISFTP